MARAEVIEAVENRITDTFETIPVYGVKLRADDPTYIRGSETPPDKSSFIVVQYPNSSNEKLTLGPERYQEIGAFRIVLNVERDAERLPFFQMANRIAALFRDKYFAGVRTGTPDSPAEDDATDRGAYVQLSFAVPYSFGYSDEG